MRNLNSAAIFRAFLFVWINKGKLHDHERIRGQNKGVANGKVNVGANTLDLRLERECNRWIGGDYENTLQLGMHAFSSATFTRARNSHGNITRRKVCSTNPKPLSMVHVQMRNMRILENTGVVQNEAMSLGAFKFESDEDIRPTFDMLGAEVSVQNVPRVSNPIPNVAVQVIVCQAFAHFRGVRRLFLPLFRITFGLITFCQFLHVPPCLKLPAQKLPPLTSKSFLH